MRPLGAIKAYLRVADPRQVTFFCSGQKKVTQEKAAPDGALSLRFAPLPVRSPTAPPCAGGEARNPSAPLTGSWAKACAARGRHTGLNVKPDTAQN